MEKAEIRSTGTATFAGQCVAVTVAVTVTGAPCALSKQQQRRKAPVVPTKATRAAAERPCLGPSRTRGTPAFHHRLLGPCCTAVLLEPRSFFA